MSDPFLSQDAFVKSWITNPFKQLNLGYTLTSFFYIAALFIGLLLIVILAAILGFNEGYKNGSTSKRQIVILGWVGFGLALLGIWFTIGNFYTVVNKINRNVREYRNCSLFLPENAENAVKILISEAVGDQKISEIIQLRTDIAAAGAESLQQATSLRTAGNEYVRPDASSSVISTKALMGELGSSVGIPTMGTLQNPTIATVSGLRQFQALPGSGRISLGFGSAAAAPAPSFATTGAQAAAAGAGTVPAVPTNTRGM